MADLSCDGISRKGKAVHGISSVGASSAVGLQYSSFGDSSRARLESRLGHADADLKALQCARSALAETVRFMQHGNPDGAPEHGLCPGPIGGKLFQERGPRPTNEPCSKHSGHA